MDGLSTYSRPLWLFRVFVGLMLILLIGVCLYILFAPKQLTVRGNVRATKSFDKTAEYEFRAKFYDATTRSNVLYTYDAKDVKLSSRGDFEFDVPNAGLLQRPTLLQICISSLNKSSTEGLPSCDWKQSTTSAKFTATVCGLTMVDRQPNSITNWLNGRNNIYTTPSLNCGKSGKGAAAPATVSTNDVVMQLLAGGNTASGNNDSGLPAIDFQPGTILAVDESGKVKSVAAADVFKNDIKSAVDEAVKNQQPSQTSNSGSTEDESEVSQNVTQIFNSFPRFVTNTTNSTNQTIVQGDKNTDNQTLGLNGNVLSISGGNSVTLPAGIIDGDETVGNELMDVAAGRGLSRVGSGTTLDPFKVGLITCANGQILKSSGASWACGSDTDTNTTYSAGTGISFAGTTINNSGVLSFTLPAGGGLTNTGSAQSPALRLQNCANGEVLQYNAGSWSCAVSSGGSSYSFAVSDGTNTQSIANGGTVSFIGNQGLAATVGAGGNVTYGVVNGGITTARLADGSVTTTKLADGGVSSAKLADGGVTTIKLADGSVTNTKIANGSVANNKLTNSSLTVGAGSGLSGGGVVALGASTTLSLQTCPSGQILKSNGSGYACAADTDTNTDAQTLSISNTGGANNTTTYTLNISGGNAITFDDRDTLYTAATSSGITLNSQAFSLQTCPVGQILKSTNGSSSGYACAADVDTNTTYSAGTGISFAGTTINNAGVLGVATPAAGGLVNTGTAQNPSLKIKDCANGEVLQYNGGTWTCVTPGSVSSYSFSVTDGTNSQSVLNGESVSFVGNQGLAATVGAGDSVTYGIVDGGVTTVKLADGSVTNTKITNGTISNAKLSNSSLNVAAGNGLSGGGVVALGASTTLSLQSCPSGQILKSNGSGYACANDNSTTDTDDQTLSISNTTDGNGTNDYTLSISGGNSIVFSDRDTLYTAATDGGLVMNGTAIGLQACPAGQVLKSTGSGYACAADNGSGASYDAGQGLSLNGSTFDANIGNGLGIDGSNNIENLGILGIGTFGALTSTGGQSPQLSINLSTTDFDQSSGELQLADSGASAGTYGSSGVSVAQISVDNKGRITNVSDRVLPNATSTITGVLSSTDFATFAAKENALSFNAPFTRAGNTVSLNTSASGTTATTSRASGLEVAGGALGLLRGCGNGQLLKWNSTTNVWACASDTDTNTDAQSLSFNNGTRVLAISGGNSVTIPDADTTYAAGTGLGLAGNTFSVNGLTATACTAGEKITWNGSALSCAADNDTDTNTTYSAGTGLSLVGTTFNNTGVLSVGGSGAVSSSGGQNPGISLTTSANFTQAGNSLDLADSGATSGTYGNSGVNVAQINVDGKGRVTSVSNRALPSASSTVTGVLSSTDFATFAGKENALSFSAPLSRSGNTISLNTAASGTTSTTSSASGLEVAGGALSILRGCSNGQLLKWNSTSNVWACGSDIDTDTNTDAQTLSFNNGTRVLTISGGNSVNIPDADTTYAAGTGLTLASNTFSISGLTATACTATQKLTWSGSALSCATDIDTDTTNFSITDGTNSQAVSAGQAVTFSGSSASKTTATVGPTRQVTFGFDFTGASSGQALVYNGSAVTWQGVASATCGVSSNYICNGGNTTGAGLTIGTNDANSLNFETDNIVRMTINEEGRINISRTGSATGGADFAITDALAGQTASLQLNNASIGTSTTDGLLLTESAAGRAVLLNQENENFFFGTNNTYKMSIAANGGVTIYDNQSSNTSAIVTNATLALDGGSGGGRGLTDFIMQNDASGRDAGDGFHINFMNSGVVDIINNENASLYLGANNLPKLGVGNGTNGIAISNDPGNFTYNSLLSLYAAGTSAGMNFYTDTSGTTGTDGLNMRLDYATGDAVINNREATSLKFGTNNSFRMYIDSAGRVGIGNATPGYLLHVGSGSVASGTSVARFENAGGTCTVTPNVSGGVTCTSDERLKKNIESFSGAVDIVNQIDVKQYNMAADADGSQKQIGVLAQQLEKVLPGLVQTDKNGFKSVSYSGLAPVLLAAVQEQQVQINDLKKGVWSGGVVTNDTTFKGQAIFEGPAKFVGAANFGGDVNITGNIRLSEDQVNAATVPAGKTRVEVPFNGTYPGAPYVTATPREFLKNKSEYRVTDVTKSGFVIELETAQSKAVRFDWHAFARSETASTGQ